MSHSGRRAETTQTSLSSRLADWLDQDEPATLGGLLAHFGQQAFAVAFVLLLTPSALPIPTGGVTHVLEAAALLLALQLVIGRDEPWLPARLRERDLSSLKSGKARSRLLGMIGKVETVARPRYARPMQSDAGRIVYGVLVAVLTVATFVAPPFSGLDTLPAMGVVVISLGVLFGDALIAGVGIAIGAGGVALLFLLAGVVTSMFGKVF